MALIQLTESQKGELYQFMGRTSKKRKTAIEKRCKIILLASECEIEQEISEKMGLDIRGIRKWIRRYQEYGISGLYNKKGAGAKPKINSRELEKIVRRNPKSFGIAATSWVSVLICVALFITCGVIVTPKTVRNHLYKLGYRYKRAKLKNPSKKLPRKIKELFSLSQIGKSIVLFLDETCVRLLPDIRGMWAKINEEIKIVLSPKSWNASFYIFGVVDLLTGKFLWKFFDKANQQYVEEFLKMILAEFQGYKIYVVLDQASYHTGKAIRNFLQNERSLELIFLPTRCPQLNPVERIWRHIKDRLANVGFKDIKSKKQFCEQMLKSLTLLKIQSLTNGWRERYAKNCA